MKSVLAQLAAIAVALLLPVGASAQSSSALAENGSAQFHIETANAPAPGMQQAADELAEYLQKVTGARFTINSGGQGPAIRLQATAGSVPGGPQAFRLSRESGDIIISANQAKALPYGVYRFLEDYAGVHWFAPGQARYASQPNLSVALQTRNYAPRFAYREVFYRHADDPEFAAHNRLNGRLGHRLQKPIDDKLGGDQSIRQVSIFDLVPPGKYGKTHPEFYGGGQLQFANPQLRQIAAEQLRAKIKSWRRRPDYILIAHADRDTYHRGGADAALIEKYNAAGAAYLDFVRDVAGRVNAQGTTILAQAYLWSRKPPQNMPALPDNMGVMLSGIERDFAKPMDAPANQGFLDDLDGWATLTSHIVVWDYITDFAGYIQPYPNLQTLAANLRLLAQRDAVEGVFAQGAYTSLGAEFAELRTWMLARLMWDPERDPQVLIETFTKGYYGPAAGFIRDYLQTLQAAAARWSGKLEDKTPPDAGYLDTAFLRRSDRLFEQAEAAVQGQPQYLQHVQTARIPVDYAVLSNRERLANAGAVNADQRLQRLQQTMQQAQITAYREGGGADPEGLLQALAVDRSGAGAAQDCADLDQKDCIVVEDDSLRLAGGGAKLIPDAAATDGGAASMPGDNTVWGLQLPLSDLLPAEGQWKIKIRARLDTAATDGVGMQAGLYPGDNHSFKVSEATGSEYRSLALPGTYRRSDADYLWLAPAGNKAVKRMLIDRIVALRVGS